MKGMIALDGNDILEADFTDLTPANESLAIMGDSGREEIEELQRQILELENQVEELADERDEYYEAIRRISSICTEYLESV